MIRTFSILLVFAACVSLSAQDQERPKGRDFGYSLKKSKSNEKNQTADNKRVANTKSNGEDIEVLKVETSLVSSEMLVLDAKGNPVIGLSDKDFDITEAGQPQRVAILAAGDDRKVGRSIVLILDYSGSQFPFIRTSVAAARALVDKLAPTDSMAIVTDDVELLQNFTRDKEQLKSKLDSLLGRKVGQSKQYSALMATLNELFTSSDHRPIVIFQTDGDELYFLRDSPLRTESPNKRAQKLFKERHVDFTLADVTRAAEKARATIYTVLPGDRLLGRSPDEQIDLIRLYLNRIPYRGPAPEKEIELIRDYFKQNFTSGALPSDVGEGLEKAITDDGLKDVLILMKTQAALTAVSLSTGGWTSFLVDPSQADRVYSNIFTDINQRYMVGYYPTNKEHDGKRRTFEVTIRNHPDYVVLGRRWYYAPAANQW